jgi:GxxExxY protein
MEIELGMRNIPFVAKPKLPIQYRGQPLRSYYEADLICYGSVIVELKALGGLSGTEEAQVLNYLKATGLRVGVLINFGEPGRLAWKRLVR